jgi:hypothetical protein
VFNFYAIIGINSNADAGCDLQPMAAENKWLLKGI